MNAQTRREMAEALAERLEARIQTMAYPNYGNVKLIDATLREWGLEMAKLGQGYQSDVAGFIRDIQVANDQQKGA